MPDKPDLTPEERELLEYEGLGWAAKRIDSLASRLAEAERERDEMAGRVMNLEAAESGWRDECQRVRAQNVRLKAGRLDDLREQIQSDMASDAERFKDKSSGELADLLLTATAGVPTAYFSLFNAIRDRLSRLAAAEEACRKAASFVGHSSSAEDWCGCEGCRVEWESILGELQSVLARAALGIPLTPSQESRE